MFSAFNPSKLLAAAGSHSAAPGLQPGALVKGDGRSINLTRVSDGGGETGVRWGIPGRHWGGGVDVLTPPTEGHVVGYLAAVVRGNWTCFTSKSMVASKPVLILAVHADSTQARMVHFHRQGASAGPTLPLV